MTKEMQASELDRIDRRIIAALVEDGRMSITELATRVGLSKTPCQYRLKKLIDSGVISGFRATLNQTKIGLDHIAFTSVKLSDTREAALEAFNAAVQKIAEVEFHNYELTKISLFSAAERL